MIIPGNPKQALSVACETVLQICRNQRVNDIFKRDNGPFMAGRLMLQHDEEMRDLSKSQLVLAGACPFINAFLRLLQYLVYKRLIDLLSIQEDFSVKRFI